MNGTREPRSRTAETPQAATLTGVIGNEAE